MASHDALKESANAMSDDMPPDRRSEDRRTTRLEERLDSLDEKFDARYYTRELLEAKLVALHIEIQTIVARLSAIEGERTWLLRIIIGSLVSAGLGVIIIFKDKAI